MLKKQKKKLKWNYSKKDKQWWIPESFPYANNGMTITKTQDGFSLNMEYYKIFLTFEHLSNARKVAQLIYEG